MSSAASRLGRQAAALNDPTGWFEALYTEAETGDAEVPWDRTEPNPLIVDWWPRTRSTRPAGGPW